MAEELLRINLMRVRREGGREGMREGGREGGNEEERESETFEQSRCVHSFPSATYPVRIILDFILWIQMKEG